MSLMLISFIPLLTPDHVAQAALTRHALLRTSARQGAEAMRTHVRKMEKTQIYTRLEILQEL